MIAEAVFVGTELLLGEILNTNAQYLGARLAELGFDHYYQTTVGDNAGRLSETLRRALERADVVITSGGLGPTQDDITREVAAAVCGRALREDPDIAADLAALFGRTGRAMTANNLRQAQVPEGATVLKNSRGTAPGLIVPASGDKAVILLPGPPHEFTRMFEDQVIPWLTARAGGTALRLYTRTLKLCGIGESAAEEAVKDLLAAQTDPTVAPYAKLGEVWFRLATKAAGPDEAAGRFAPVEAAIAERLGRYLFGRDEETLEQVVGDLLRQKGQTLTAAESCTGGLLSKRITDVPGSSAYFLVGLVTYANQAKTDQLGVPEAMLTEFGAVSEAVVRQMARGAQERTGADWALATSGIAGPGGGTPEKPVGLVWFGLAGPAGLLKARPLQFRGGRDEVRRGAAQYALSYLWHHLAHGA